MSEQFPVRLSAERLINVKEIQVGAGSTVLKVNKEGLFMGADNFTDAPFKVTFAGAMTATGITVGDGSITTAKLADGAVTTGKIAANTIEAGDIKASTITATEIAANTITSTQLNATSINAMGIVAGSVNASNVTAGTITGSVVQSTRGNGKILLDTDDALKFYDGAGAVQGTLKGYADDLRISAADNIDLWAGGRTALNLGYTFCVPYDDAHYTLGNQTGHGFERVCSYAFTNPSDRRLKRDIKTIRSALDKIMELRGVSFKWKQKNISDGRRQIGLIAQEVKKVLPEVVNGKGGKENYAIDYGNMAGLFVESIKEPQKQIEKLTKRITNLERSESLLSRKSRNSKKVNSV